MVKRKNKLIISEKRWEKIRQVASSRQKDFVVVLEDVFDPHNAAAILRTCDGFGVQKVFFIFDAVKPYNPKKVGKASSSSANKWLDFEIFKSTKKCLNKLKRNGYEIMATILDEEAESIFKTNFKNKKIALLVGNEHRGLSQKAIEMADKKLYIPMKGMVQSFNVSVTMAIFIYEITRQRTKKIKNYIVDKKEKKKIINDFIRR